VCHGQGCCWMLVIPGTYHLELRTVSLQQSIHRYIAVEPDVQV
jgi:hypothetical protein